ncbi:MAG TPA: TfuA domain-containing protein [Thermoanaerobaculia bacterium]|nr:TfuA domain-containing protein [Thermoanaerobaculia bacterium]
MPDVIVFAGPCLAAPGGFAAELAEIPGIEIRPPARRGDLLAAVARRPHTLVLLDGYYYTVGAVTHKELLYALEAGIRVIGAASLGALRAAEMAPFGMLGVGKIFAWFRDGALDGDDEVALLHAPEELGYRAVTVALVEVRDALEHLVEEGAVEAAAAGVLVGELKRLPFSERHPARIEALAAGLLGEPGRQRLARRLASFSRKAADAREALALARTPPPAASVSAAAPSRALDYFSADRERWLRVPISPGLPIAPEISLAQTWGVVQLLHPDAPELVRGWRLRYLLASAVRWAGLAAEPAREAARLAVLEGHLAEHFGQPFLPRAELVEEARLQAASELALETWGGTGPALRALAKRFGVGASDGGGGVPRLLATLEEQAAALPPWWLARSFAFCSDLGAALAATRAAAEVHGCFRVWAAGARVGRGALLALAADLWGCPEAAVAAEAARRGLTDRRGYSVGLYESAALLAPAERLRRPVNRYPELRAELRGCRLSYLFELPAL